MRISSRNILLLFLFGLVTIPLYATKGLTLDSCLSMARKNNISLRRSELQIEKAKQVKAQALTKYFPQISASTFGYHSLHPIVEIGIDDVSNANARDILTTLYGNYGEALGLQNTISLFQYGYTAGITAIQPVFVGGKIVAGNQLAQVGVEAAKLQSDVASRDILEQVEESYWLVIGLGEKQKTVHHLSSLLDTVYQTVNQAVISGLALRSDLLQVEIKKEELKAQSLQLANGIKLARRALCQSIGLEYTDSLIFISDSLAFDSKEQESLINLVDKKTPESDLLALQVKATQLQKRMILADALPQVAIGAGYAYSNYQANFMRNGLGKSTGNGAVFVTATVPITQWWETGHKLREYSISEELARLEQNDLDEKLALRTQQAYDKMQESALLVLSAQSEVDKAIENARLMAANYHAGMATITDLLTAQTLLLKAQNDLTDTRIAYRVNFRRYKDLTSY